MKVQITLTHGEKSARLKFENFPVAAFETLLNKTISFLGSVKSVKTSIQPKIKISSFKTAEVKMESVTETSPTNDVVSLLPEKLREWYKQQEEKANAEGKPTFYLTGIKIKDGIPHYKVFYECPNCGFKGVRYEKEDVKEVQCYQCSSPIDVFPIKGQFPKRDEWNNYFRSVEVEE